MIYLFLDREIRYNLKAYKFAGCEFALAKFKFPSIFYASFKDIKQRIFFYPAGHASLATTTTILRDMVLKKMKLYSKKRRYFSCISVSLTRPSVNTTSNPINKSIKELSFHLFTFKFSSIKNINFLYSFLLLSQQLKKLQQFNQFLPLYTFVV